MDLIKQLLRKSNPTTVTAWAEDIAPQVILLMGLPASGKTTFIKSDLIKYYNHRIPHLKGFAEVNSDRHLQKHQHNRANEDFRMLKDISPERWESVTRGMTYMSNDGSPVTFPLSYEDYHKIKNEGVFWKAMYKPYYATYFGGRAEAKKDTDALMDKKVKGSDVVVIDSIGANYQKMLKIFARFKEEGYTTSVVYLDIDVKYSIARDKYRGDVEGRTVGSTVIRSYVPELEPAYKAYVASDLVDRVLRFDWTGGVTVSSGKYKLVKEVKKYPKKS